MFYLAIGFVGMAMVTASVIYFYSKQDLLGLATDKYTLYISTSDVNVSAGGLSFSLKAGKTDKEVAWKIYTQIKTRITAVSFNEQYDSLQISNKSLHEVFLFIREEISKIPLARVRSSRNDQMVDFYLSILNNGIRPYLSKWHSPISDWVEKEQKKSPDKSLIEIEKAFPERKEALIDLNDMNLRMNTISEELLKIVKN